MRKTAEAASRATSSEALHVRLAQPGDRASLAALVAAMGGHEDILERECPLRSLAALIDASDCRVVVAELRATVVGFAAIAARTSPLHDRREAWLGALAVAPSARDSGVGTALLAEAERCAAQLGCSSIVLESSHSRDRAHAFYRTRGFGEVAPARRFERRVATHESSLVGRFLDAAARAASRVAEAIAGMQAERALGTGADGAPTEAADRAAERAALAELLPLGFPVVSEKAGLVGAGTIDSAQPWISLDPLDGSRNFIAGYAPYATSMALVAAGRPLAGLAVDLAGGHRWEVRAGGGALRDGRRVRARRGPLAAVPSPLPGRLLRHLPGVQRTRISGSTVTDLCRVADGSLAAFFALDRRAVHVHDLAAAMLLIEEAGGAVLDRGGNVPLLVPDATICLDIVAAADVAYARELLALT